MRKKYHFMGNLRILYFMPDSPMSGKAGNTTRLNQMLSYLEQQQHLEVHFVSLRDWGMWQDQDRLAFRKKYTNLQLHLLDKKSKKHFFKYLFLYKIPYLFRRNQIDLTSYLLRHSFKKILKKIGTIDTAIISYASWGALADALPNSTYKINDTHDFITAQYKDKRKIVGKLFQNEIDILKKYDEIWTYSVEEEYIFEQFTEKKVQLMPISFPDNIHKHQENFKYSIVYVASENPHNVKGIHWFLEEVLPLLENVDIHIIGKIKDSIQKKYPNVVLYGMVEDLESFYTQAKVAICPMLSGTGIKIKVLEALSYGLPVVTNRRGVDGLFNKKNNGCLYTDNPVDFADYIKKLLENPIFYQEMKAETAAYFRNNHSFSAEYKILNNIFEIKK